MFTCSDCSESNVFPSSFVNGKSFLEHFSFHHNKLIASGSMICSHVDCTGRKFDQFNSFRKHILNHKSSSLLPPTQSEQAKGNECLPCKRQKTESTLANVIEGSSPPSDGTTEINTCSPEFPDESISFTEKLNEAVIAFIAGLYDCGYFTETQIQHVVESQIQLVSGGFFSILKKSVFKVLHTTTSDSTVKSAEINKISQMFESFQNMFQGYATQQLRLSEFQKCGAYIKPESFVIGSARNEKKVDGRVIIDTIALTGQFVPFRHVLKGFLELPGVLSETLRYVSYLENSRSEQTVMENIMQGKLWKEKIKPKFQRKCVFPLIFYFDDYETNKEIGAHTGVHKLGAGYVKLGCLPPKFASALENIFLTVLSHSGDRAFGNKEVFRKVINEFQFLEETGISVVTEEGVTQVYFALAIAEGDNLGLNALLEYVECFSANYFCRVCYEEREATKTQTESNAAKRRTRESYLSDLGKKESLTGRKGECVFNDLNSFHVYENISVDTMHDLDEGVWKYVMFEIIRYLYDKERLSVDYLNELIQGFSYGCNEENNKMPYISKDDLCVNKRLKCTASEMRCLVRYFGLIVGHLIKTEDEAVWNLYLKARQILDIVSAPVVSLRDADVLKDLIREHHSQYMALFGQHLRPKFHIVTHYPEIIVELGPLDPLNCYRSEHKHQKGKDVARGSNNRLNLPLTIAKRAQLKVALRLLCRRGFRSIFQYSLVHNVQVDTIEHYNWFRSAIPAQLIDKNVWATVNSLKVNGNTFKVGCVVLHSVDSNFPVFGKVHVIRISKGNNAHLLLKVLKVKTFNKHYHAFEVDDDVSEDSQWLLVDINNLVSHLSTNVFVRPCGTFVPYRFSVACVAQRRDTFIHLG